MKDRLCFRRKAQAVFLCIIKTNCFDFSLDNCTALCYTIIINRCMMYTTVKTVISWELIYNANKT